MHLAGMHITILASKEKFFSKTFFTATRFVAFLNTPGNFTTAWVTKHYLRPGRGEVSNEHNDDTATQERENPSSDQPARLFLRQRPGRDTGARTDQHPRHEHLQNQSAGPRGQTDSGKGVHPQEPPAASVTEKQTDHQGQLAPRHPSGPARAAETETETRAQQSEPTERQSPVRGQRGH